MISKRDRRHVMFAVPPELMLLALFHNCVVEGLPEGIEPTDIIYDFERRAFLVRVWHESFAIVPACDPTPEVTPTLTCKTS